MKININLTEEDIDFILKKNGYTKNNVTLWSEKHIGPYDMFDGMEGAVRTVAYPENKIPDGLYSAEPRLEDFSEYLIENVVSRLFVLTAIGRNNDA